MTPKTVWIIGAGLLSDIYVAVLNDLGYRPLVIGRGTASAERITAATGVEAVTGGLASFLETAPERPRGAIVVTGVEALAATTAQLIEYGVTDILCEKPGALALAELQAVAEAASRTSTRCYIAYNRRFYAATQEARRMLEEDGGVLSFHFEFTEWSERIAAVRKAPGVLENWVLGNSSHVIDLAFHLGGWPLELNTQVGGQNRLDFHPRASVFTGCGRTADGALFSYCANWDAPGRWSVEAMSRNVRVILCPMEELQIVRRGTIKREPVEIDDTVDKRHKHGLYRQVSAFLGHESGPLCTVQEQLTHWPLLERIAGYA